MMGNAGLKRASEVYIASNMVKNDIVYPVTVLVTQVAILNANYMAARLRDHYKILFSDGIKSESMAV